MSSFSETLSPCAAVAVSQYRSSLVTRRVKSLGKTVTKIFTSLREDCMVFFAPFNEFVK